ncbi:hypothetical protein D3C84_868380 [compost metagenome]
MISTVDCGSSCCMAATSHGSSAAAFKPLDSVCAVRAAGNIPVASTAHAPCKRGPSLNVSRTDSASVCRSTTSARTCSTVEPFKAPTDCASARRCCTYRPKIPRGGNSSLIGTGCSFDSGHPPAAMYSVSHWVRSSALSGSTLMRAALPLSVWPSSTAL